MVFLAKLVFKRKVRWGAEDRLHKSIIRVVSSEWIPPEVVWTKADQKWKYRPR